MTSIRISVKKMSLLIICSTLLTPFLIVNSSSITAILQSDLITPTNRYGHTLVYDISNSRIILYGGVIKSEGMSVWHINDTWSYYGNNQTWVPIKTISSPGLIAHHATTYDSVNRKIICFGGLTESGDVLNSTWIFDCDTNEWSKSSPSLEPSPRADSSMYYDSNNGKIILFGGHGSVGDSISYLNDLWVYDVNNNTWTRRESVNSPEARYGHRVVYDSLTCQAILFGGRTARGVRDEVWTYDYSNNSWQLIDQGLKPGGRYWHTMAYNTNNHQVIMFGGRESEYISTALLSDTWIYDIMQNEWKQVTSSSIPPASTSACSVYDPVINQVVLFGGATKIAPTTITNETWTFTCEENNWQLLSFSRSSTQTSGFGYILPLFGLPLLYYKRKTP
jgi:N-acetylneuraminic acid mutarotase